MKKDRLFLILILAFFLLALLFLCIRFPFLLWDENAYLGNARALIKLSNYTEDFRFPLLEYIIASVWLFIGESVFVAKLIIILFSLGAAFLLYLISKRFLKYPLIPVLFFVSNYLVLFWSFRVYADMVGVFFILLSAYLMIKKKIALSGVAASLAVLSRFPNVLFGIAIGMHLLLNRKLKEAINFSVAALLTLVPWLLFNTIKYKNPLYDLMDLVRAISLYTVSEPISIQLTNLFYIMNFFIIFVFIGIYISRKNKNLLFAWFFSVFFIIYHFFFVNLKLERYYLILVPFLYIIGTIGLEKVFKNKKKLVLGIVVIFLLHTTVSLYILNEKLQVDKCNDNGVMQQSIDYLKTQSISGKTIISNSWPWFGYYLNSKISSTWTTDINVLLDSLGPSYFVIIKYGGLEFDHNLLANNKRTTYLINFEDNCGNQAVIYSGE